MTLFPHLAASDTTTPLEPEQAADLLMEAALALHGNGQETAVTQAAIEQFGIALGHRATLILRWGEIIVSVESKQGRQVLRLGTTTPDSVAMNRVIGSMGLIGSVEGRSEKWGQAAAVMHAVAKLPPSGDLLFVTACAVGAVMLGFISGATRWEALLAIAFSTAAGAVIRRVAARHGAGPLLQPFLAAVVAGLVGALAVRWQFSSALRLVAVAPCMVLVPGPHILNGALDLLAFRIPLAISRLTFAALVLLAISIGLLAGLALAGGDLPPFEPGRSVPIWIDVPAAAIVAMCYGVFYSMPKRMLGWPAAAGAVAHAAHWWVMATFGLSAAMAAGVAGFVAAVILVPVVRRYRLPFAGVGFASVVSLLPGVFVFRMMSGVVEIAAAGADIPAKLLNAVLTDAITAFAIVLAMTLGLAVPKRFYDKLSPSNIAERSPV